jgi:hypothetical protein
MLSPDAPSDDAPTGVVEVDAEPAGQIGATLPVGDVAPTEAVRPGWGKVKTNLDSTVEALKRENDALKQENTALKLKRENEALRQENATLAAPEQENTALKLTAENEALRQENATLAGPPSMGTAVDTVVDTGWGRVKTNLDSTAEALKRENDAVVARPASGRSRSLSGWGKVKERVEEKVMLRLNSNNKVVSDKRDHIIESMPFNDKMGVLVAYMVHNFWNCWVFLNFVNFDAAKALLNATDGQIGLITTMGWLGILSTVPVVVITKNHTQWLYIAGVLNCLAPVARAFAAAAGSATLVIVTNFVAGMGFGILSAWPAMLAAMWPEEQRTVVTAVACLSNYVGGAAGVVIIPLVAYDSETLLSFLYVQAVFAAVPFGEPSILNTCLLVL